MRWRSLRVAAALLWFAGAGGPAFAHDVPPSLVMLDIGRNSIDVELQLQLNELGSALQLPLAAGPDTVIAQYGPLIGQYIRERLNISSRDGRSYALTINSLALRHTDNANWISNDWLVAQLELQAPPGSSTELFTLDYSVILQRVVSHQALIYIRRDVRNGLLGDQPLLVGMIGYGTTRLDVDGSAGSWWHGFVRLFSLGLRHIAEGPDHLLFLLALLLPAPLLVSHRRWCASCKRPVATVRTIVKVVSGFTLGHSLTLALAAAGWLVPPGRLVEILIAVSILVSSLHAWRPLFAGREVWIATGFGLVHGLAFAETLAGLNFDGWTLALSLLGFNLGIESMQLLVIAATLPLMMALSTTRNYAAVRTAGAGFAGACAVGWILERAFGLANPLGPLVNWLAPPPVWFVTGLCLASGVSIPCLAGWSRWPRLRLRFAARATR